MTRVTRWHGWRLFLSSEGFTTLSQLIITDRCQLLHGECLYSEHLCHGGRGEARFAVWLQAFGSV